MRFAACAALAALALAGCNPQPERQATPAPSQTPTPVGLPPLKISGHGTGGQPVRIVQSLGNRKQYELVARSYISHSTKSIAQATFQQATVTFYGKDGTKMAAQAPTARLDEKANQVVLEGGVHAKTSKGQNLICDRLTFDRGTGLLHGEGNVRITGDQGGEEQVLTGNSFTSDLKLTQMVMK